MMVAVTSPLKKILLPLVLMLVLIIPLYLGQYVAYDVKAFLYSLSVSMQDILIFLLPLIIFSFIFSTLINLQSNVLKFIAMLVGLVFISNLIAISIGYSVGAFFLPQLDIQPHIPANGEILLKTLWKLSLPKWIPNHIALLTGFVLGILFSYKQNNYADALATRLHFAASYFLKRIFTPLLPLFILGFVFKLEQDQLLEKALRIYGPVFFIVVGTQLTYMIFLYMAVAKFSIKKFWFYIKNVLPATITGLSTLSSAATMPVLILCTEKNLDQPEVADIIVPATVNIHTLGSAIGLTILSLTTLLAFSHPFPSVLEFGEFAIFYALAKFSVAAVPGGAIIVAMPLLVEHLSFTPEMVGLITAIYMMFDPFGTATNVTGNGFFAIAFSKLYPFKFDEHEEDKVESLL